MIYLDNATTTKMSKMAIDAIFPFMDGVYGNPSSFHSVGQRANEALTFTNKAVVEALDGLPAHKLHCSVLAEEAIKKALQDYYEKNGIEYDRKQFPNCENCNHCCNN